VRKIQAIALVAFSGWAMMGCAEFFRQGTTTTNVGKIPAKDGKASMQALCDVQRTRTRAELLKRVQIEKFREVALKVSDEVTKDEIADLTRMEFTRRIGNDTWEIGRARGELIAEIYTGAIVRAGFKPEASEPFTGSDLSYTLAIDAGEAGMDPYAEFLEGNLSKNLGAEGTYAKVALAANANQSRYYVTLYEFSRYETHAGGTQIPIFTSTNLFDAASADLPRYCDSNVGTALSVEDFNTVGGLGSPSTEAPAPQPAPVPAPAPAPVPAPAPAPVPSPVS